VTQATGNDRLVDVAMAPTGEALGVFKNGDAIKLAFRPAGARAAFDLDNATTINPSPGDTSTTPVALTIDPDGGADLLYRSEHTGSRIYLETRRPAGGAFLDAGPVRLAADRVVALLARTHGGQGVLARP
jgi:hypothetical protein